MVTTVANATIEDTETVTQQLLSILNNGGRKWFVQRFTKEGKRRSVWFGVGDDWRRFHKHYSQWQTGQNVYFGVNPTRESVTDKDRAKFTQDGVTPKDSYIEQYVGSKNDTIAAVNCVFTEIDGKDFTFPSEDEIAAHIPAVTAEKQKMVDSGEFKRLPSAKAIYNEAVGLAKQAKYITDPQHYNALALAHLSNAPLEASVCWCSGGGYQAVWLFDETFVIDSQEARELIQWLQSAWVGVVGGDDGAKDIRRILRLPGTQNVKKHWAPNYPTVTYEWADFDRVYNINQIIAHVPPRPQKSEERRQSTPLQSSNGSGAAYGDDSVINRFNATYKVVDILDDNGYTGQGSERSRPGASSSNGVDISDDGFISWHWSSNDPLHDPKPDGNPHKTTSFTAFLVLEHGGNLKKAVRAAAELLGMGRDRDNHFGAMDDTPQTSAELFASLQEVATGDKHIDPDTGEIIEDDTTATPSAKLQMSPGRRIKYPVDGVKRIVKIVGLNTALTVEGGPNVYDAEYADDDGALWPITVSDDDDGIELMTASAPKPKAPAATVATIDDVLSAINVIANNADLKPTDRQKQIVRGLSTAIGDVNRSHHTEIVTALEQANAGFTQTAAKEFVRGCVADAKKRNKTAERQRKEAARQNLLTVRAKKGKASIDVGNRQLSDIADEALQVLVSSNASDPNVFVRGGALARIVQDERGHYGIQEFSGGALMGELADVADWETVGLDDDGNPQSRAVFPPRDVVSKIHTAAEWPGIPALTGVVNAPVFSRSGELHDQPGYNAATRLYYTGGVKVGDTTPTPGNIDRAKDLILNNLLVDFPFKDDASRAHAVAYLLLPFVRDMIDGPTPVHTVDSPTAGTGKGKLTAACAIPFLGHDVPTQPAVVDDNEWRKIITTRLMIGDTHMIIDNVNHELNSGSLASAFTQPVWTDRALGSNREVKIPIRTIWGITANNIQMSQELARRCIWIRLDANAEKPWERSEFKHKNLIGWARANRDQLATAAITFVRAWVDQGMPLYDKRTKGSYEAWAGIIGGILDAVGIPGFLENETELYDRVVSKNDLMIDFVKAWWEKQQWLERKRHIDAKTEICLSSQDLFKLASYRDFDPEDDGGEWQNLLGDMLTSPKQRGRQTQLGKILDAHADKVVAGYKIKLAKTANGSKFWVLQSTLVEPQNEVLPGSTDVVPNGAATGGRGLAEPHCEVLPRIEVLPASPRFKVHHGKTEAAVFESASYRCQSCETSKWSVPLRLITVTGGYNVLCEKCAARHG